MGTGTQLEKAAHDGLPADIVDKLGGIYWMEGNAGVDEDLATFQYGVWSEENRAWYRNRQTQASHHCTMTRYMRT